MELAKKQTATQSQKLMVFVLTMALYGLATLFTELIPSFQVGVVEFSVEYFLFIPLTLAMLFDPLSAALGAATGELVFSEIMLGQFGGLGELEKFLTVTIGVYVAGRMVKNPRTTRWWASPPSPARRCSWPWALWWTSARCSLPWRILRLWPACRKASSPPRALPSSTTCCSPASCSACCPRCSWCPSSTGRLSPCWAWPPARKRPVVGGVSPKVVLGCVIGFVVAVATQLIAKSGFSIVDWEADWAGSGTALAIGLVVAAALAVIVLAVLKWKAGKDGTTAG